MPGLSTKETSALGPRSPYERQASHAILLVVLACLLLFSGAAARQVVKGVPPLAPAAASPSPVAESAGGSVRLSGGPGTDLVGTWFRSTRPTTLWNSPDEQAQALASVRAWAYMQVIGPVNGPRVEVRYVEGGTPALNAWVATADISPSAPPSATAVATAVAVAPAPPRKDTTVEPPSISATYAVVIDEASGEILYGENPHGHVAPASLTKIVTAQLALEHANLDDSVTVDVDSRTMWESTIMGLTPGETVSMRALLYGLMLPSGNDAAIAIARYVSGSEESFAGLMNARVAELGLQDSHFSNPHGLDADDHYSSPYDMVMLARHGMRDGNFAALASAKTWSGEGYHLTNLNRMLTLYPGADGVKVGYTDNSGRAIVASATVGGHRVYVGLMRAPDMLNDCIALFNYAFNNYTWPSSSTSTDAA